MDSYYLKFKTNKKLYLGSDTGEAAKAVFYHNISKTTKNTF